MAERRSFLMVPVLKLYWHHTLRYTWLFWSAVLFSVLTYAIDVISPLYYKKLFDVLGGATPTDAAFRILLSVLVVIVALNLFQSLITRRVANFTTLFLDAKVMTDLLDDAFTYLLGHSYHFFTSNFTGSLVRRVTRLSRSYEAIMDQVMYSLLPIVVNVLGILVVLFSRSVILGVALLVWMILFMTVQFFLVRWKQPYDIRKAAEDSRVTGTLSDAVTNEFNIKLFSGNAHEGRLFGNVTADLKRITTLSWSLDEIINTIQGLLMFAIQVVLLYVAIVYWRKGVLTIGDFALIQAYLINLFGQLWNFGNSFRRLYEAFADAYEMVEILEEPHEITDAPGAAPLAVSRGAIDFNDVEFRFHKARPVLKQLNLSIKGGEKVALVGASGAGKSTIVRLLFRLYDIDGGAITIDGQNIASVTQESLHDAIALVPQEPILFHRSLLENIRYGRRDATDEEVIEAARLAHCHEFIARFPESYATFVGERGVKLSGGEKQRVAIARAILKNAPILVLDEATSSLDSESEALIQDALATLMKGKTVIVIAHRLSTIMQMDRIIVLEDGEVVDQGTHRQLLRKDSLYKRLWDIQAGGFLGGEEETE